MHGKINVTVYFIQEGRGGPIKIGVTERCPLKRLADMQTGCPKELRLLGQTEGDRHKETELHHVFREHWIRGEWFRPHPEVLEFVRALHGKQAPPPVAPRSPRREPGDRRALRTEYSEASDAVWAVWKRAEAGRVAERIAVRLKHKETL
jgi:hypothetical protein